MIEKIIVKREKNGNYIMFFPECRNNDGSIETWSTVADNPGFGHCHCSASYDYYRDCRPVGYTDIDVIKFVTDYVKYIRTLPDMTDYVIKMVKRIQR